VALAAALLELQQLTERLRRDCPWDREQTLATIVPQITASPAWQSDGLLFITADESDGFGDRVPLVVVGPTVHGQRFTAPLDHFSLLATTADALGVARPGQATEATPLVTG